MRLQVCSEYASASDEAAAEVALPTIVLHQSSVEVARRGSESIDLNGALKRGTDPSSVVPKRCPCGHLFLVNAAARGKFFDDCRATRRCRNCGKVGGHVPSCVQARPRPCRGCGTDLGHGVGTRLYCDACKAQQCPECQHYGGQHGGWCHYAHRQRRGTRRPGVFHGIVTEQDIIGVFITLRARAVRVARRIVGDVWAEDITADSSCRS